jgi:hypothetical protein
MRTIHIDEEVHYMLKKFAVSEKVTIKEAVESALKDYFDVEWRELQEEHEDLTSDEEKDNAFHYDERDKTRPETFR